LAPPSTANTCLVLEPTHDWMSPYVHYLKTGHLPTNANKEWQTKAARFMMIDNDLYKRGYGQPLLKCVTKQEAQYVIKEIYKGI